MRQFTVENGIIVPDPGHEAAWSVYEDLVVKNFHSLNRFCQTSQIYYNEKFRKAFMTLWNLASDVERWHVVEHQPGLVNDMLDECRPEWNLHGLFTPEQLAHLTIVA